MPRIAQHFVSERLIPAIDIVEFIGHTVPLKKSGSGYVCCCPFHQEKTPSFHVSPERQTYYCFGCREHGNVLSFLMKLRNLRFPEAVEELARSCGIEVEYEAGSGGDAQQSLRYKSWYALMSDAADYYQYLLMRNPRAGEYCTITRGLSSEIVAGFQLGYAPDEFDYLHKGFIENAGRESDLLTLGLLRLNRSGTGTYCAFRNRIMIPIRDTRGRVIGFGGRLLPRPEQQDGGGEARSEAKYINSPTDSPLFRKGRVVFGLYEALRANNHALRRLVLVEGYMDVIALAMAGISYAAAAMGTATTPEQLREIFAHTSEVVFCYDGDAPGRNAAWHALEAVTPFLSQGRSVRFAFLPEGEDPDSLVRAHGARAFEQVLEASLPYAEYLVSYCRQRHDLSDSNQLSAFLSETMGMIARIPEEALRLVTLQVLAEAAHMAEDSLRAMLRRNMEEAAAARPAPPPAEPGRTDGVLTTPMRRLVAFVLQRPQTVAALSGELALGHFADLCRRLGVRGIEQLCGYLAQIEERSDINAAQFLERARGTAEESAVSRLIEADLGLPETEDEETAVRSCAGLFIRLLGQVLHAGLDECRSALEGGGGEMSRDQAELIHAIQHVQLLRFTN